MLKKILSKIQAELDGVFLHIDAVDDEMSDETYEMLEKIAAKVTLVSNTPVVGTWEKRNKARLVLSYGEKVLCWVKTNPAFGAVNEHLRYGEFLERDDDDCGIFIFDESEEGKYFKVTHFAVVSGPSDS